MSNVYTVNSTESFMDSLAADILSKAGDDPLALSDIEIIVPHFRAGRALKNAFLRQSDKDLLVLPDIQTITHMDDDDQSLRVAADPEISGKLMNMLPAVSPLERQIFLAQKIMAMPSVASSPKKSVQLAGELGRFIDMAESYDLDLKKLDEIVPKKFGAHWGKTLDFFKVIIQEWPEHLEKNNRVDRAVFRRESLRLQAEFWQKHPPKKQIIAAGFTMGDPATMDLLKTIAHMETGKLVLPGLDKGMDQKNWDAVGVTHPQHGLKTLLNHIGVTKEEVKDWPTPKHRTQNLGRRFYPQERQKLLSEVMRPSQTSDQWSKLVKPKPATATRKAKPGDVDIKALSGMDLSTCDHSHEEANIIALKIRGALEKENQTVALVTPDHTLMRKVATKLRFWDIRVQTELGSDLASSKLGTWLSSTSTMVTKDLKPRSVVRCLKHPYASGGEDTDAFRQKIELFEEKVLRGTRPQGGFDGMQDKLKTAFRIYTKQGQKLSAEDKKKQEKLDTLSSWLDNIAEKAKDFMDATSGEPKPFVKILEAHIAFAEAMAETDEQSGAEMLWSTEEGKVASRFLSELHSVAKDFPAITGRDYTNMIEGLMSNVKIKPVIPEHPQITLTDPKSFRLRSADVMILGGLNEGVWPSEAQANPWMSRDMMEDFGLPSPDAAVGQAAHDFVEMASMPNVFMTRSQREGNAPAVISPFLSRMRMVLAAVDLLDDLESKEQLSAINRALLTPARQHSTAAPEPKPPASARPDKLPVTAIETWMRDPYSLYAKYILKLKPWQAIDAPPNMAMRGNIIHDALEKFIKKYPSGLPHDAEKKLTEIGKEAFGEHLENPMVKAFWWPRFERIADWFVQTERSRRETYETLAAESRGELLIETEDKPFTLTAIIDRIDRNVNADTLSLIDYKTGSVPTQKAVIDGLSSQLVLEALIAASGGVKGVESGDVDKLEYWKLSGTNEVGKISEVKANIDILTEEAFDGLRKLIETFNDPKTPYMPVPRPRFAPRYNNYAELSRIGEWKDAVNDIKPKPKRKRKAPAKKAATRAKKPAPKAPEGGQ